MSLWLQHTFSNLITLRLWFFAAVLGYLASLVVGRDIGLILLPIIAVVLAALPGLTLRCPRCLSLVKAGADTCRRCGHNTRVLQNVRAAEKNREEQTWE